jgi:hypothetical protein
MLGRMSWASFRQACGLAAPWHDESLGGAWFPLDQPLPRWRTCCYIAVNDSGEILYVGRVRRSDAGGLRGRFSSHHRRHEAWTGVWVIPLLPTTPAIAVDNTEAALISILRPLENVTTPEMRTG